MPLLKIATWNVNGLRSYIVDDLPSQKFGTSAIKTEIHPESNLGELVATFDPDIICFQETRCDQATMERFQIPGYYNYHSSSRGTGPRAGNRYSGVAVWSKIQAESTLSDLPTLPPPLTAADTEGRFISLYFGPKIGYLINTYQPNAGTNFDYRVNRWDPALRTYLSSLLRAGHPVVWCGDLNVARTPLDLHLGQPKTTVEEQGHWESLDRPGPSADSPDNYRWNPGFTTEERLNLELTLETGLVDAWRQLHPHAEYTGYTWWNQRVPAYRKSDRGWRIDYCLVDEAHLGRLVACDRLAEIGCRSRERESIKKFGSDHCVVTVTLEY